MTVELDLPPGPPPDPPKRPINPKGLYCLNCRGVRLHNICSRKPCPGRRVRYLVCSACHTRLKSIETLDTSYVPVIQRSKATTRAKDVTAETVEKGKQLRQLLLGNENASG